MGPLAAPQYAVANDEAGPVHRKDRGCASESHCSCAHKRRSAESWFSIPPNLWPARNRRLRPCRLELVVGTWITPAEPEQWFVARKRFPTVSHYKRNQSLSGLVATKNEVRLMGSIVVLTHAWIEPVFRSSLHG